MDTALSPKSLAQHLTQLGNELRCRHLLPVLPTGEQGYLRPEVFYLTCCQIAYCLHQLTQCVFPTFSEGIVYFPVATALHRYN